MTADDSGAELARLRRENDDLKGKLASAGKMGGTSGRDLLDLREALNKKDKEILSLREQLSQKDDELFASRDRELALEHEKADHGELLRERLEAREKELQAEREQALESLAAEYAAEIRRLRDELTDATGVRERALVEREAVWAAERRALDAELVALRTEIEQARPRLDAELAMHAQESERLRAVVSRLTSEVERGRAVLDKVRAKLEEDRLSLGRAREALVTAVAQIEEIEGRTLE